MEAVALFERVLRVSLPRLEFRFSSRQKAGYGVHAMALKKILPDLDREALKLVWSFGASSGFRPEPDEAWQMTEPPE